MMNSIQQYILNNWDSIGIKGKRPKKLSSMQISAGLGKRYDRGRLIHLIFRNNELKPFIVAKFCRSKEYEYHLKNESKICNIIREKYDAIYPPEQIHQTIVGGKLVTFEEFIDGFSYKILLDNLVASSDYSPETLQKMIQQHFDQASHIICHLNKYAEKIDKTHIEKELENLINHFKEYYRNDDEFLELIDKETCSILETLPQEVYRRIVDFDLTPQNIICKGNDARVIDWEFSEISTLLFLEPLRFLYYYLQELFQLRVFLENDFKKIFIYLMKSNNEQWFINLMHDFYSKSNPYKLSIENGFLIFLIFEADLQLRTTNYQEIPRNYYKDLITKFVNNLSLIEGVDIELKSEYAKRIENMRKITDKDNKIIELNSVIQAKDAYISELYSTIQSKDTHIAELNGAIQSKDTHITDLNAHITDLKSTLQSIQQSLIWRSVMFFQNQVIERLFPHNTGRGRIYYLALNSVRNIVNKGVSWLRFKDNRNQDEKIIPDPKILMRNRLLHFLSQPKGTLSFPKFEDPIVSIIILTFNKAEFTYQCLESLREHTSIPYELILIDNGSNDETSSLFDRLENVITIKNKENLGFIKGCNLGASKSKGKYVLFLNNDIVVTPGWLTDLVRTIENYPQCGAVGCKLIWPDGKLQEAGSILWNDGSALGYGRGDNPKNPEYSYIREVDYCSGACLLVRGDLFRNLGGFDERFVPAYYEDSDLCLGIRKLNFRIIYQSHVEVIHHEFTSSSFEKAKSLMEVNKEKFIEKWCETLKNKLTPSQKNIIQARDNRPGKRILVLDDRIPTPNQGSGFPRAYNMLKFMGELGYKVTFYPFSNSTPWQPSTNEFQELGIEVFYGNDLDFKKFSGDRMKYYDLILLSRPHNMKNLYDTIKKYFSNAILVYDAEALFTVREILMAKVKGIELSDNKKKNLIKEEIDLMKKADIVITVSQNEKKMIVENGEINNVYVWGHPIDVKKFRNGFNERKDILFVGGFLAGKDSPNEDAILYFAKEVFPEIQKELSCNLIIVGIDPTEAVKKLSSSSIIVTGYVDNIEEYYEKCKVFVVPHRYAAGIPWKLQEAMSYGIPSVVSELIASQLDLKDNVEVLIANDRKEFARKISKIYRDEKLWYKIQNNAAESIKEECDPVKLKKELKEIIEFDNK